MRWNTLTVMVKCTNAVVSWQSCDCLVLALHHMMSARLCYGSLVSQTLPMSFVTYSIIKWMTAGVVRFMRLVLCCVVCCFCLLMWYAEVSIHTSGMERAQHIHSCDVDHSVCLLFILSTLTELVIEGHQRPPGLVSTQCESLPIVSDTTQLWGCSPSTLFQSVWMVMWTQGCSMPFLKQILN